MYQIIQMLTGNFQIICQIQDGNERWQETDLKAAIKKLKKAAKAYNGTKIKKKDIQFLREVPRTDTTLVAWEPRPV